MDHDAKRIGGGGTLIYNIAWCEQTTHIESKHLVVGVLFSKALLSLFECTDWLICPPGPEDTIFIISLACKDMYMKLYVHQGGNGSEYHICWESKIFEEFNCPS